MKPQRVVPAGGAGAKPGRGAVQASQDHAPNCGSLPPALTALPRARLGLRECPYGIYHLCLKATDAGQGEPHSPQGGCGRSPDTSKATRPVDGQRDMSPGLPLLPRTEGWVTGRAVGAVIPQLERSVTLPRGGVAAPPSQQLQAFPPRRRLAYLPLHPWGPEDMVALTSGACQGPAVCRWRTMAWPAQGSGVRGDAN